MLKQIILVGIGGGVGSILRFLISELTAKYYFNSFPLSTFLVNIIGCFFIGLLMGILGQNIQTNQHLKLLFITGFCGGYTTFSTFATENVSLLQTNHYWTMILYIGLSITAGLVAVGLGMALAKG